MAIASNRPDWKELAKIAIGQEGMFTTQQAAEVGYSIQYGIAYKEKYQRIAINAKPAQDEREVQAGDKGFSPHGPMDSGTRVPSRSEAQELRDRAADEIEMTGFYRIAFGLLKIILTATIIWILRKVVPPDAPEAASVASAGG